MTDLQPAQPSQRRDAWRALFSDDPIPAARAIRRAQRTLAKDNELPLLLAASAALSDKDASSLLKELDTDDADSIILSQWDDSPHVRQGTYATALRFGWTLPDGPLRDFLLAELDVLTPDDPTHTRDLQAALHLLALTHPTEAWNTAGICAPVLIAALPLLPDSSRDALLQAYSSSLSSSLLNQHRLPDPQPIHALITLELLASPYCELLVTDVARHTSFSPAIVAGALASRSAQFAIQSAINNQTEAFPFQDDELPSESIDPSLLRGLLDQLQIPYEDLSLDRLRATLHHRGDFGQRTRSTLHITLTASRLTLSIPLPHLQPTPETMHRLLSLNHICGTPSFSLDISNTPTLNVIIPQDGFTESVFSSSVESLRSTLERLYED